MGVQTHPLALKYGFNMTWKILLPLHDYSLYALKSIYVKLYIENFLWYIAKVRYYKFFSFFPVYSKGRFSNSLYFFNKFFNLNNFRNLRKRKSFSGFVKKVYLKKKYRKIKQNFLFSNVYYKDFIFNWGFLKHLYYKRLRVFVSKFLYKYKIWLGKFLVLQKKFKLILKGKGNVLRPIRFYSLKKKKKFFFFWRSMFFNKVFNYMYLDSKLKNKQFSKISMLYLFKMKKKFYKQQLLLAKTKNRRFKRRKFKLKKNKYVPKKLKFSSSLKRKNVVEMLSNSSIKKGEISFEYFLKNVMKNIKNKSIKFYYFFLFNFFNKNFFFCSYLKFKLMEKKKKFQNMFVYKIKPFFFFNEKRLNLEKFKNKFKYRYSFLKNKKYLINSEENPVLFYSSIVRSLKKGNKLVTASYRLESFSLEYTNGCFFIYFNTNVPKRLYLFLFCVTKYTLSDLIIWDFFYLLRQLLIDRIERVLNKYLKSVVKLIWRDIGNSLFYNYDAYTRELNRKKLLSANILRKSKLGYAYLVNTIHTALYWGSSMLLGNLFYEKLTNIRVALPTIFLIFNIMKVLLTTIVHRKNVVVKIVGAFKKGAKKRSLKFDMFGAKPYTTIAKVCDFFFIRCSTRTGTLGFKIYII